MEKNTTLIVVGVAVLLAGLMSFLILSGDKSGSSDRKKGSGALPGLQETPAPWQPEYSGLAERIATLGIPTPGTEKYHVHTRLKVFVDGQEVPVPPNVGINTQARIASALHTHDTDGLIHIEADQPFKVTLGDFVTIWGVKFSKDQLGSYRSDAGKTVQVFVNGQPVPDGPAYEVKAKDQIIIGYGAVGSFPAAFSEPFPANL